MVDVLVVQEQTEEFQSAFSGVSDRLRHTITYVRDRSSFESLEVRCAPDICFVDILLPDAEGFEVCKAVNSRWPGTHVVLMSAIFASKEMIREDFDGAEADGFLSLPATSIALEEALLKWREATPDTAPGQDERASKPLARSNMLRGGRADLRKGAKVLIVEDQKDLNYIYRGFVNALGLEAVGAFDGLSGLEMIKAGLPDIALIDMHLPGIGGMEVCRRIKSMTDEVPVILMSSIHSSGDELRGEMARNGADDFLHKPFTMSGLGKTLTTYLPDGDMDGDDALISVVQNQADIGDHMRVEVPDVGDLSSVDFSSLLFRIYRDKRSGRLTIKRDEVVRVVHLLTGRPHWTESNSVDESLATLLEKRGILEMDRVNEIVLDSDYEGDLGRVLIERGLVSEAELEVGMRELVRMRTMSCFALEQGSYRFEPDVGKDKTLKSKPLNTLKLIREGVVRYSSANELALKMEGLVKRYVAQTSHYPTFLSSFPCSDEEKRFMSSINGRATLSELLKSRTLDITHALRLVWGLYHARMVIFSDIPGDSITRPLRSVSSMPAQGVHGGGKLAQPQEGNHSVWSQIFGNQ